MARGFRSNEGSGMNKVIQLCEASSLALTPVSRVAAHRAPGKWRHPQQINASADLSPLNSEYRLGLGFGRRSHEELGHGPLHR
jgi:hypothetical protein